MYRHGESYPGFLLITEDRKWCEVDILCSYSGFNLIRISNINNKNQLHVPAFSALLQDLSQLSSLLSWLLLALKLHPAESTKNSLNEHQNEMNWIFVFHRPALKRQSFFVALVLMVIQESIQDHSLIKVLICLKLLIYLFQSFMFLMHSCRSCPK